MFHGTVDYFSFFDCSGPFFKLNFIILFTFFIIYYHIIFIIVVFRLGSHRPSALLFFVPAIFLSILTPHFLASLSVYLSYFILAVPMRECLGKHSCTSSPVPHHTEWYLIFSRAEIVLALAEASPFKI